MIDGEFNLPPRVGTADQDQQNYVFDNFERRFDAMNFLNQHSRTIVKSHFPPPSGLLDDIDLIYNIMSPGKKPNIKPAERAKMKQKAARQAEIAAREEAEGEMDSHVF